MISTGTRGAGFLWGCSHRKKVSHFEFQVVIKIEKSRNGDKNACISLFFPQILNLILQFVAKIAREDGSLMADPVIKKSKKKKIFQNKNFFFKILKILGV